MAHSVQMLDTHLHQTANFHCGEPSLDNWLQTMASQHKKRNISSTFVCIDDRQPSTIIGYYALTVSEITKDELPELLKKMPQTIPVIKLGRLAIDLQFQGQGYGQFLFTDALTRAASQVAGVGLVVDALNNKVAQYYRNLGFTPFHADGLRLFYELAKLK